MEGTKVSSGAAKATTHPRILLVSSLFAPEVGGVCSVAESLATAISEHVIVLASKTPSLPEGVSDWETYDHRFQYPVHRINTFETEFPRWIPPRLRGPLQFLFNTVWTRPQVMRSALRLISLYSIDIICLNTLGSYWLPRSLQRFQPKLKSIFYLHGEEVGNRSPARRIDKLRRNALQKANAIVAVSSFTQSLVQRDELANAKIMVINNGVDIKRFTPGPKDSSIEQRFGLTGKKVLLCLARLDKRKGQDMLIRSMPEILARVPDAVLLIVGSGAEHDRLVALTQELQLEDSVIFAGFAAASELVSYYRSADVFAMPNRELASGDTEGFGLVFLEAGACAKPVIGGKAGGVPDAIVESETGYLVDGQSTAEIAHACIRLLENPELAKRLGEQGLVHSLQNTWPIQAGKFLSLCKLISEAARG